MGEQTGSDMRKLFTLRKKLIRDEIILNTANGYGTDGSFLAINRYSSITRQVGRAMSYVDSATLGMSITINIPGKYFAWGVQWGSATGDQAWGISINTTEGATAIFSVAATTIHSFAYVNAANTANHASLAAWLNAGDVVRAHGDTKVSSNTSRCQFGIIALELDN